MAYDLKMAKHGRNMS